LIYIFILQKKISFGINVDQTWRKEMKVLLIIVSIITLVLAGIAYYFYDMHNKLQSELEASRNASDELTFKVSSLEQEKDKIKVSLSKKLPIFLRKRNRRLHE